jgi:hypothetical protein
MGVRTGQGVTRVGRAGGGGGPAAAVAAAAHCDIRRRAGPHHMHAPGGQADEGASVAALHRWLGGEPGQAAPAGQRRLHAGVS